MQSTDNYYIRKQQSISDIPTDIVNLFIYGYGNSLNQLIFSQSFRVLKSITVGKECFQHVREFVINGLASLESVKIGEKCFGVYNGVCRITNCPNLRQLEIGNYGFADFKSFELSNLNSLQSIKFGRYCFEYAEEFSLKGE